nr:uncharacterized protein LOC108064799 [Drosophila takahashii]
MGVVWFFGKIYISNWPSIGPFEFRFKAIRYSLTAQNRKTNLIARELVLISNQSRSRYILRSRDKPKKMDPKKTLTWFFGLTSVRYSQILIVVAGDLLALSNLYPKHSMYISRPFLLWQDLPEEDKLSLD